MTLTVAVAGATGYAGTEILRMLLQHPAYQSGELVIRTLAGSSTVGQTVGSLMPHLVPLADRVIEPIEAVAGADIIFLCLPHGHSGAIAEELGGDALVIDASADFRLTDSSAWEEFYGSEYAGSWPYGLPEMPGHREQLAQTRRIATPGCFVTGATLAAMPAVAGKLIDPHQIRIVSFSGNSGAGKSASVPLLGAETMGSARAYKVGGVHRHTPEIEQNLSEIAGSPVKVSFTPVLAPMSRGILTTVSAPVALGVTAAQVREEYARAYADEPFVYLLPKKQQPETQNVVGSNAVHVQVEVDTRTGLLVATSAIDNLTKGTSGQAIQAMNIALGWPETDGLSVVGVAP